LRGAAGLHPGTPRLHATCGKRLPPPPPPPRPAAPSPRTTRLDQLEAPTADAPSSWLRPYAPSSRMTRMEPISGSVLGRESGGHEWSPWGRGGVGSVGTRSLQASGGPSAPGWSPADMGHAGAGRAGAPAAAH